MKTPKRYPATMSVYASKTELYNDRARWKRKNRVARLKNTIARLHKELANCDTNRLIARNQLGRFHDFFLRLARSAQNVEDKKFWLERVGATNLILALTMSPEELDRDFAGEDVKPCNLKLTEEERALIHEVYGKERE